MGDEHETTSGERALGRTVDRVFVIVPCFDEEGNVERFHGEVCAALEGLADLEFHILFVDDGSSDRTLSKLNELRAGDPRVIVASLSRNFGHQVALSAGLSVADGDAVIVMDADLQHPPSLLPKLIERWRDRSDPVDLVLAVRRSTTGAPFFKRVNSRLFYWLIHRLTDTPIIPGVADFCLLSRQAHVALNRMPERHRFLRGMVAWLGFPRAFIEYDAPDRMVGESKYGLGRMVGLALDAILSFSATPIRVMTRIGLCITLLGLGYFTYVVGRAVLLGDLVRGWGSLISVVLLLGGLQLVFLGVIGEYVARVFEEVKGRPLFVFKQEPELPKRRAD